MGYLDVITIVLVASMLGVEFAVSAFINPVLRRVVERGAQGLAISMFAARLGRAMPFWYVGCLLAMLAEAILRRHDGGASLIWTAVAIWAAVIAVTLVFLVPINNRLMRVSAENFTEAVERQHWTWEVRHRLRIAALATATVLMLVGIGV